MASTTEGHPPAAHTLATGGGLRLVSSVVGLLGGLVVTAVLVRTLGLEQFGAYALALSLTSLLAIVAEMGIGTGATRMAAFLEPGRARGWVRRGFRVAVVSGSLLGAGTLVAAWFMPADVRLAMVVAAPLIPLWALWSVQRGYLAAHRRPVLVESVTMGAQLATFALALVLVTLGFASAPTVLAAHVVVRAVAVALLGLAIRRAGGSAAVDRTDVRTWEVLGLSIPLMLGGLAGIVLQRSDVIMIGIIGGATAAGSYEPILRLLDVAPLILSALGFYLFPIGAALVRDHQFERLRAAYVSISKWGMVCTLPLLTAMLIVPVPLLEWLFGGGFGAAGPVASTLAVGYIVNVVTGVNGGALVALGATRQIAARSAVSVGVNLIGNAVLIPRFGASGAALATTIVTVGLNGFNAALAWRMARLTPFRRDSVACLVAMVAAAAVAALVLPTTMSTEPAAAISLIVVVGGVGGSVALLTLHPSERRLARALAARIRSQGPPDDPPTRDRGGSNPPTAASVPRGRAAT